MGFRNQGGLERKFDTGKRFDDADPKNHDQRRNAKDDSVCGD